MSGLGSLDLLDVSGRILAGGHASLADCISRPAYSSTNTASTSVGFREE
jgi:hypothetical protein